MKEYLWRLAGADEFVLKQSGKGSRYSFALIGFSYSIVYLIIFFSFFGFFWGVFHSPLISILGSLVFSFLIGNIYRVVLISLEPQTLPVKPEKGSIVFAYFVRIGTVLLFSFFVSKCLETTLMGHWVDSYIEGEIARKYAVTRFNTSEMFIEHMKVLNREYPKVWIVTGLVSFVFLYPVFLRHILKGKKEYYDIKKKIDIQIVMSEYKKYLLVRDKIYISLYEMYNDSKMCFKPHLKVYSDEPFKTKKLDKPLPSKTMEDFLNINEWS